MNIRWGILSAANIAFEQVVPAIRRSIRSEVIAIASNSEYKMQRFQIPTMYKNYDELLQDDRIDAVYIPLPNALHANYIIEAVRNKKHVLVEKPIALFSSEMDAIEQILHSSNSIVLEAFMYQHHEQHAQVKKWLREEKIGVIKHLKAHFSWQIEDKNDIRLSKKLGGGALFDVGCYCMHAFTTIFNFKPKQISYIQTEANDVDLTGICTMIDSKQVTATFVCSMNMPFYDMYEAIGDNGSIRVEHSFRPDFAPNGEGIVTLFGPNREIIEKITFKDDQYLRQIEFFEKVIENPLLMQPMWNASKKNTFYLEQAYASLKNNKTIILED